MIFIFFIRDYKYINKVQTTFLGFSNHPLAMTSSEDATAGFPFFRLPVLVQWKILRQYVPILVKIHVLEKIPEFTNLLEDRSSWTDVFDELAESISILRSLREGLYVPSSENIPEHGYYVSWSDSGNSVTFTLCCISSRVYQLFPFKVHRFGVSTRASNLRDFLKRFLEEYCPLERKKIIAYQFNNYHDFFIDPLTDSLMWCGRIRPIKNNKLTIGNGKITSDWRNHQIFLKKDYTVELHLYREKCTLKPKSLESHLLNDDEYNFHNRCNDLLRDEWEGGPLPFTRKAGQFEISLKQNEEISVDVSTANVYVTWRHNNADLFNILSNDIVEKILVLKNTPLSVMNA